MRMFLSGITSKVLSTTLVVSAVLLATSYPVFCDTTCTNNPQSTSTLESDRKAFRANHLPWAVDENPEQVGQLIKNGEDVNAMDEDGRTALHLAVEANHYGLAKMLLENGAKVNVKEHSMEGCYRGLGWYPLHLALRNENRDIVNLLIEHGADVNAVRTDDWTPIFTAAYHGQPDVVSLLIAKGAKINRQNGEPLRVAISQGKIEAARILIRNGALVNSSRPNGKTALHVAAALGDLAEVKLLLNSKAKADLRDKEGKTPLYEAAYWGYPDVVRMLIANGASVSSKTNDGSSILTAVSIGKREYAPSGWPEHASSKRDWAGVRTVLLQHGAKE